MSTIADLGTFGTDWWYAYSPGQRVMGDDGGWRATVHFLTTNAHLEAFLLAVAGTVVTQTTTYGSLQRIVPLQHPLYSKLWANRVEAETFGTASTSSTALIDLHSNARVTVEFASVLFPTFSGVGGGTPTDDTAYMQWDIDQSSNYTTIAGRKFKFPDSEPIDQDSGILNVLNNYILTLYQCPTLDDSVIDEISGTINDDVFFGKPAGQLLFNGCKSTQTVTMAGVSSIIKQFSFTYRDYRWDEAYKRDATLDTPLDPDGLTMYTESNFNLLLT